METVIGIILALGVLLFKVAKKINDADQPKVKPARPVVAPEIQTVSETETEKLEDVQAAKPRGSSPIFQAAVEETKEKEKIDPKKLIVYSEIMNRKY